VLNWHLPSNQTDGQAEKTVENRTFSAGTPVRVILRKNLGKEIPDESTAWSARVFLN